MSCWKKRGTLSIYLTVNVPRVTDGADVARGVRWRGCQRAGRIRGARPATETVRRHDTDPRPAGTTR
jgi:hypothetical protein